MKAIGADETLDVTTKAIAWAIALHAGAHSCQAWPSYETIGRFANVTPETVQRKVRILDDKGWLRIMKRGLGRGHHNVYRLLMAVDNSEENPYQDPPLGTENPYQDQRKPVPGSPFVRSKTRTEHPPNRGKRTGDENPDPALAATLADLASQTSINGNGETPIRGDSLRRLLIAQGLLLDE